MSDRQFSRAVIAPDVNDDESSFQGTAFTGVFDGNHHTISNLTIIGDSYLGLFGQVGQWFDAAGEVLNLGLDAVHIIGTGDLVPKGVNHRRLN